MIYTKKKINSDHSDHHIYINVTINVRFEQERVSYLIIFVPGYEN